MFNVIGDLVEWDGILVMVIRQDVTPTDRQRMVTLLEEITDEDEDESYSDALAERDALRAILGIKS